MEIFISNSILHSINDEMEKCLVKINIFYQKITSCSLILHNTHTHTHTHTYIYIYIYMYIESYQRLKIWYLMPP